MGNRFRPSFIEEEILYHLSRSVEEEVPEASQIIVFGSRARGDSNEDSDLDIAIVLDAPYIEKWIWEKLWDIKRRVQEGLQADELPITLTPIAQRDLVSRDFGVEKTIKTEGITVWRRGS